ncbi:MAG TPA: hypothetical protein VNM15_02440 [Candidatus Binatia bacterium]|nr:hypothetical protein [Candidatus Binatia bacterium]
MLTEEAALVRKGCDSKNNRLAGAGRLLIEHRQPRGYAFAAARIAAAAV